MPTFKKASPKLRSSNAGNLTRIRSLEKRVTQLEADLLELVQKCVAMARHVKTLEKL
jgi:hypothetical protein